MVNNIFQGAVFKQELQCIRLQNQEVKKKPEKDNKALGNIPDIQSPDDSLNSSVTPR
jgi:hypothetical protein